VPDRRCKTLSSSDRTGVDGLDADLSLEVTAPSLGGANKENKTQGRVRHGPKIVY